MRARIIIICFVFGAFIALVWLRGGRDKAEPTTPDTAAVAAKEPSPAARSGSEPQQPVRPMLADAPSAKAIQSSTVEEPNAATSRLLEAWQSPIDFYGKVLDKNSNAVPGASVRFTWSENPLDDGQKSSATESDREGLFLLRGKRGASLEIWVAKEGYLH